MDWEAVLKSIDELVFKQTRKHLDSLQVEIVKGVLNGQKYPEIAKKYKCSKGHVKDEAYKLWQVLSKSLGEDINRSNFCATVERLGFANSQYQIINNPIQINNLNLCSNSESPGLDNGDMGNPELNQEKTRPSDDRTFETLLHETKLNSLSKLIQLGLSAEQIAEALDLPLDEVREAIINTHSNG
jgi:hypothetical protein